MTTVNIFTTTPSSRSRSHLDLVFYSKLGGLATEEILSQKKIGFLLRLNEQIIESSSGRKNKPTIGLITSHGLVQIERQIRCADKDTTILSKNE